MYIQMVQGACTRQDEMRGLVDDWCGRMADQPGWLGGTYGFTDDDRFVGVVRYDSRDACATWCARPEAAMLWAGAETMFDSACEIHESEDVSMMFEGGSDDAGFVQVMRGQVGDADFLRAMSTDTEMTTMLHQARPDILGATMLIEDDGSFTETIAFTDESSARTGERQEMPPEMSARMEKAMTGVEYLDLHHPWFASHR